MKNDVSFKALQNLSINRDEPPVPKCGASKSESRIERIPGECEGHAPPRRQVTLSEFTRRKACHVMLIAVIRAPNHAVLRTVGIKLLRSRIRRAATQIADLVGFGPNLHWHVAPSLPPPLSSLRLRLCLFSFEAFDFPAPACRFTDHQTDRSTAIGRGSLLRRRIVEAWRGGQ